MNYFFRLHSILTSARPTRDLHHSSSYVLVNKNEQKKRPNFVTPRILKTHQRQFTSLTSRKKLLLAPIGTRGLGWVPTVIRGVLKIRYLLLGGAIGNAQFSSNLYVFLTILTSIGLKPLSALSLIANNEETAKKVEEDRKKTEAERHVL